MLKNYKNHISIIAYVLSALFPFVMTVVMTNTMGLVDFATLSTPIYYAATIGLFAQLGIPIFVLVEGTKQKKSGDMNAELRVYNIALTWWVLSTIGSILLLLLIYILVCNLGYKLSGVEIVLMIFLIPYYASINIRKRILQTNNRITSSVFWDGILFPIIVTISFAIFNYLNVSNFWYYAIVYMLASYIATFGCVLEFLKSTSYKFISFDFKGALHLAYNKRGLILTLLSFMLALNGRLDVIVASSEMSGYLLGVYIVFNRIATGTMLLQDALIYKYSTKLYGEKYESFKSIYRIIQIVSVIFASLVLFAAYFFPSIIYNTFKIDSHTSLVPLYILLLCCILRSLLGPSSMVLLMNQMNKQVLYTFVFSAFVFIFFVFFIKLFNDHLINISVSYLISESISSLILYYLMNNSFKTVYNAAK